MKILAIDDSPTLRKFISKHLTTYSNTYEVLVAATGEDGVKEAMDQCPDLILLDFILPDFTGDEVCRRLLAKEKTADIPVILMSSSAPDIEKNEGEFKNITRSMIKPFSPQLLCASVSSVLRKMATPSNRRPASTKMEKKSPLVIPKPKPPITITEDKSQVNGNILFCGKTSYFPIFEALKGIETERASGILEFQLETGTHQAYFRSGAPVLVTTKNIDAYLAGGKLDIPRESREYFESTKRKQQETGQPIFSMMLAEKYLPEVQANSFIEQYGNFLFAEIWTTPAVSFKFIETKKMPSYLPKKNLKNSMLNWITTTLRCVDIRNPLVEEIAQPQDILNFTAGGHQSIQTFSLTEEEVSFVSQLKNGEITIGQAADNLDLKWAEASRILFLFKTTQIMEIWPAG